MRCPAMRGFPAHTPGVRTTCSAMTGAKPWPPWETVGVVIIPGYASPLTPDKGRPPPVRPVRAGGRAARWTCPAGWRSLTARSAGRPLARRQIADGVGAVAWAQQTQVAGATTEFRAAAAAPEDDYAAWVTTEGTPGT